MYALTTLNATNFTVTLQESGPDWATIVLMFTTVALAVITSLYMLETRRLRRETAQMVVETRSMAEETKKARIQAQLPIFAVEPGDFLWLLGESMPRDFSKLNLVNHGQTATDITVECSWLENAESAGSGRTFYILSLARNGFARLDLPTEEIVRKSLLLRVRIKCKDASGKDYETVITNGFDKIKGTSTKIAYQNNYWLMLYGVIKEVKEILRSKR
jgi:hypothetical protein